MTALPRILAQIVDDVRLRNDKRRARVPLHAYDKIPSIGGRSRFLRALAGSGTTILAECKRRSPSAGRLVQSEDVLERAQAYRRGGAAALSVLTERDHFHGSRAQLVRARAAGLPILRKDFILDEGMVIESAAMGASAVLLIARCLDARTLLRCAERARQHNLATLIEIHDFSELAPALDAGPNAIGVNARNLDTMTIDLAPALELLSRVPRTVLRIAESGVQGPDDVVRARAAGADSVLVGSALVRSLDPESTLREMVEAGRSAS
ncbi:MAG: indole-3-glycerol phosphate synthase [Planctomycetota bacterium]|jgi:indole-3-glycerol phosphate synthase